MPLNPYDIGQIYADMELDLIGSMKRNLSRHELEEKMEGFTWEQWQKAKLKDIQRYQKRNKKMISEYQKLIDKQVAHTIGTSFNKGAKNSESFIKRMLGKAGSAVKSIFEPKEKNFFKLNEDKVNALIRSVTGDLHNANYAALRKMDDVYRQTLFKTQMYYSNGAIGLEKAVDMATKDFLSKGIDCITYKNGRQVNIASYAEMSIRTANQRATLMGEGAKRDEYGVHTVCSAIHGNTCPLCVEWQGKVLIDDVYSGGSSKDGDYPLLSTAMGAGFLHPNCRHHPTTFFPGINTVPTPLTEEEQAKALERYKAEQKQREIERDIRKWKRVEAGSLEPDNVAASTLRVDQLQAKMREHLGQYSYLKREPWREKLRENAGLRANNSGNLNNKQGAHMTQPIRRLSDLSYEAVNNVLKEYEMEIVGLDHEVAIVVTKDGGVYRIEGDKNSVNPQIIGEDKLKGAKITHNHPINETEFSFSDSDRQLFMQYSVEELHGIDDNYEYVLNRNSKDIDIDNISVFERMSMDEQSQLEYAAHSENVRKCGELKIGYRRKKRE